MIVGVLCGLVTAAMHATGYVFSRRFVVVQHASVLRLLVLGHVIMAVIAAIVFPLFYTIDMPPLVELWQPLVLASLFYFVGQTGLFVALSRTDASRISPLLGLKVVVVALLSMLLLDTPLTIMQWTAVGLSVVAAWILNASGGYLPPTSVIGTIFAVTCYSLSDIYIWQLIGVMGPMGEVRGPVVAALLCYGLSGLACVPALPWFGSRRRGDWLWAGPYAITWLGGIIFMFLAFAFAGLVLANIAVGTRGLISIALGVLLARLGMEHLEKRVSTGVLLRRAIAAVAMVLAIAIFVIAAQNT